VSSLVPAKGFREIARAWPSLRRAIPGIRLEVVGGTELYGEGSAGRLIPTDPDFEREILRSIPESDIRAGIVRFHGVMGAEKFDVLSMCDFALLNPTGVSEAFPATPLECMAMGLPVIASDDFGMADCMRDFPELTVKRSGDIARRAKWLVSDVARYRALRARSLNTARNFAARAERNLGDWISLLEGLFEGGSALPALRPNAELHGSRHLLVYRRDIKPAVIAAGRRLFRFAVRR
jgi:glycosyltransferase involved in cell wall biosynthesis